MRHVSSLNGLIYSSYIDFAFKYDSSRSTIGRGYSSPKVMFASLSISRFSFHGA